MAINFSSAISAYQNAARAAMGDRPQTGAEAGIQTAEAANRPSFTGMVRESLESAANVGHTAERMSIQGIAGEAEVRDVVLAVNNAETTLTTVVAVRDKVVAAYQEIMRMPI